MNFVTKTQLQDIVEYIGDSIHVPQLVQHFDKENIYSTDEKIIGCWIDGKPLYQKTFSFTSQNSVNTGKTVDIGASVDSVVSYKACLKGSGNAWVDVVCCVNQTDDKVAARVLVTDNNNTAPNTINLTFTSTTPASWLNRPVYVTLQYTKTTDVAGSYNIADENDYSTTEKIIGTWDDGSPIYQCDFTDAVPQNTTAGTITNLTLRTLPGCRIMNYKMAFKKASNGNIVTLPAINGTGYRVQLRTSWDGSQSSVILFTEQSVYTTDKIKYTLQYIKTTG